MFRKIIITAIVVLFSLAASNAQIEVDRIETNYVVEPSGTPITLQAARSVTIKPNSHFKSGSTVTIRIDEEAYIPPTFTEDNYVFSRNYQKELNDADDIIYNSDVIEKITYYDGLGRSKQDIDIKFTPNRYDLITHKFYDNTGRPSKEYLPYKALGNNAMFRSDALSMTNSFYVSNYGNDLNSSNPNPYSQKEFEDAILNRLTKQSSPGYDWRMGGNNEIEYEYKLNTSQDNIRLFEINFSGGDTQNPQLVENNIYPSNRLTRKIVRDENHNGSSKNHTTEEFKDKRGRIILKRTYADVPGNSQEKHDTYYVYDDYGNLTFVIPPKASDNGTINTAILNELCFQYKYDEKNRLIEKKMPGKGGVNNIWEYIVYNKNDQPILTQDPNLKAQNAWLFTKYDHFGRIAYTGRMGRDVSRATLQSEANAASSTYVVPKNGSSIGNTTVEYNNEAYPINNISDIYTINFYGGQYFNAGGLTVPSSVYGQTVTTNNQNLPTGSRIRVLNMPRNVYIWITSVLGYDDKGRVVYNASKNNYLGTTDIVETKLDFSGKILETKTTHKKLGKTDIVTIDVFDYDHMGRVLTQTRTLDGHTEVLVQQQYDELGNLKQRKLGNTLSTPLQIVDYSYNIRGWLKKINNVNSLGSDLFAFEVNYNNPQLSILGSSALYNGNISETLWRSKSDNIPRAYGFGYDALDRITAANFTDNVAVATAKYNTTYGYDKNGNMKGLTRNGWQNTANYSNMDDLDYVYYDNSNKLKKVSDSGNNSYGFKDLDDTAEEYAYDSNGNMNKDANKEIISVSYNHLNMPTDITLEKNGITSYVDYKYDANGNKVEKQVNNRTVTPNVITTTQYDGDYVYENGSLKFINHSQGYVEPNGNGGYNYVYQFRDYLKSTRLGFSDTNHNGAIEPSTEIMEEYNYYPFGLAHLGYRVLNGVEYNHKTYQGQEIHKEIGLNAIEFKYRYYNPEVGRFWSIDPIAEDFPYNAPYAFGENKLGMGIELEGLEVYPNDMVFFIIREGQDIINQFNTGVTKVYESTTTDKLSSQISSADPAFDTSRARIENIEKFSSGLHDISESTTRAGHFTLDVAGASQIPVIAEAADGANAIWYGVEEDYVNAGLSGFSLIPFGIGDAVGKGGKGILILGKAHKIGKYVDEVKGAFHMFKDGFGLGISGLNEANTIMNAMYRIVENGGKLVFDLGDVSLNVAKGGFKNYNVAAEAGQITEWELSKILRDPDLFSNSVFHIDGAYKSASGFGLKLIN